MVSSSLNFNHRIVKGFSKGLYIHATVLTYL